MGWASDALERDIMRAARSSGLFTSGGLTIYRGGSDGWCSNSSSSYSDNAYEREQKRKAKEAEEKAKIENEDTFSLRGLCLNDEIETFEIDEEDIEEDEEEQVSTEEIIEIEKDKRKTLSKNQLSQTYDIQATHCFGSNGHKNHLCTCQVSIDGLIFISNVQLWLSKDTGEYSVTMPSRQGKDNKYKNDIFIGNNMLKLRILDACLEAYNKENR